MNGQKETNQILRQDANLRLINLHSPCDLKKKKKIEREKKEKMDARKRAHRRYTSLRF